MRQSMMRKNRLGLASIRCQQTETDHHQNYWAGADKAAHDNCITEKNEKKFLRDNSLKSVLQSTTGALSWPNSFYCVPLGCVPPIS